LEIARQGRIAVLRLAIFICVVASTAPAWAGCPPSQYLSVPRIIDLAYANARSALIDAGFQPLLDWNRMQRDYDMPAQAWIAETHFFEVQGCSGSGAGECRANFADIYRNLLRVTIGTDSAGAPKVTDAFFVCGTDAANVFDPSN
jgi:hypothetical protein